MLFDIKRSNYICNSEKSPHMSTTIESTNSWRDEIELEFRLLKDYLVEENMCKVGNNTEIFYQLYGKGDKKLIIIMGLNGTHHHWLKQVLYFAQLEEYQVCVFDNRGIGLSDKPLGKYSIKRLSKDTLKLLDHIGWTENVHLVGMSMGGMIAQQLCLLRPSNFSTLTLTSTYHNALTSIPTVQDILFFLHMITKSPESWHKPLISITFPKRWRSQEHSPGVNRKEYLVNLFSYFQTVMPSQNFATLFLQGLAALNHIILPSQLKKIREKGIKCIVIHGAKDRVIRMKNGIELSSLLDCPFIQLKGGGHAVMIQDPDTYNKLLRAHVNRIELDAYLQDVPIVKDKENHWTIYDGLTSKPQKAVVKTKSLASFQSSLTLIPQLIQNWKGSINSGTKTST
ncbi:alpha/beta-hydrolase [Conidiobolus coronatus NRRL 28638]|uniref:Alpha/beta-hydrolase n=1 Tax=Conidiobolus coronatus (strain ATCC 28846 / CBS 209.66 / NRRL 28638) TaxID=796925 RepID=A0A137P5Q1_CONC2|nr:alpha/beta-hydrolase [Conidiobolus coronatus NRRL 28638]|eukprot:KXN70251.1 alpha/beta-hydrolase [Conidiobolus coronatus NRRL 28638]